MQLTQLPTLLPMPMPAGLQQEHLHGASEYDVHTNYYKVTPRLSRAQAIDRRLLASVDSNGAKYRHRDERRAALIVQLKVHFMARLNLNTEMLIREIQAKCALHTPALVPTTHTRCDR
jgi:hypothetical protein